MAGSAKNQQLNRIVVVTDPDGRVMLAERGKFADWLPVSLSTSGRLGPLEAVTRAGSPEEPTYSAPTPTRGFFR